MVWTILSMVALVLTGGFISYYGDLQGRRWGKKRVSWFGLRPKHTAIIITSLSGAVIALISVAAVLVVSPSVRAVVLQGERAINENRQIRERQRHDEEEFQVKQKTYFVQLASMTQTLEDKKREVSHAEADVARLTGANHDLEDTNSKLGSGNMELQRQRAALQRNADEQRRQVADQANQIARQTSFIKDLARQTTDELRKNGDLTLENNKLQATKNELTESNSKLKSENVKLTGANATLAKEYDSKQDYYTAAERAYNRSLDELNTLQEKQETLKRKTASLQIEIDGMTQQRDELANLLNGSNERFGRELLALRHTRYNLRAQTEIARRTLDAHLSQPAAKEEILALLKDASEYSKRLGASLGDNGRAVAIVSKRVVTPASTQITDESASIDALAESVAGSNMPVVVVARTINNTTANEQVVIELTPYESSVVFKPEATVASRTIDSRLPVDKLVESVIVFLRSDVRKAAINAGTIPQVSPDTGEQEVGAIDTADLVALLDRVRKAGGVVQVTAVANQEITSGDLLTFGQTKAGGTPHNLRLDIKRAPVKSPSAAEPVTN